MAAKLRYQESIARINDFEKRRLNSTRSNADLFNSLLHELAQRSNYLIWTFSLLAIQIIEIIALAKVYFIYFPPESLNILRLLSSISLLGLTLSLATAKFYYRYSWTENRPKAHVLARMARQIFWLMTLVALALVLYLILGTRLHLTAPPIFRAVILSHIVTLPFGLCASFILFNQNGFGAPPLRTGLRMLALITSLFCIATLILDLPLIYLALGLFPKISLLAYLWKNIVRLPLKTLFLAEGAITKVTMRQEIRILLDISPVLAILILLESSQYLSLNRLAFWDSGVSMLVFFSHKIIHLGSALGLRHCFSRFRVIELLRQANCWQTLRSEHFRIRVHLLLAGLVALTILPLLFIERTSLFWASPTGDHFNINHGLLGLIIIYSLSRIQALGSAALLLHNRYRWIAFLVTLTLLGLSTTVCQIIANNQIGSRADEEILALLLVTDILATLLLGLYFRYLALAPRYASHTDITSGPNDFFSRAATAGDRHLFSIRFWNDISPELLDQQSDLSLVKELRTLTPLVALSNSELLIAAPAQLAEQIKLSLARRYPAAIKQYKELRCNDFSMNGLLKCLHDKSDKLLSDGIYRRMLQRSILTEPIAQAEIDFLEQLANNKKSAYFEYLSDGTLILYKHKGWKLPRDLSLQQQHSILKYLRTLEQSEQVLFTEVWNRHSASGLLHLNKNSRAQLIILLPVAQRGRLDRLRRLALYYNLQDFAAFSLASKLEGPYAQSS